MAEREVKMSFDAAEWAAGATQRLGAAQTEIASALMRGIEGKPRTFVRRLQIAKERLEDAIREIDRAIEHQPLPEDKADA